MSKKTLITGILILVVALGIFVGVNGCGDNNPVVYRTITVTDTTVVQDSTGHGKKDHDKKDKKNK